MSANQQRPSRNGRSYDTLCMNEDGTPKETGVLVTVDTAESFMRSANANAKVIQTVECTNGYIHVIDGVMLPYEVRLLYLPNLGLSALRHSWFLPLSSIFVQGKVVPFGPGSESKDAGLASFNKDPGASGEERYTGVSGKK